MAMVVRANRDKAAPGGHISTFASSATLYEIGYNHFFRARTTDHSGDQIYFQGHAAPGMYARAFVEGRLSEEQLINFRRELQPGGGLSSYPHPWLMPDFWQFPTVSMGLGPILSIYQARFNKYLENRGLKQSDDGRVWAFLGDGECDEPETLGAITLAAREKLDNLTWVINCNLQRLDGPVRGNGKIIQELEATFRGAGWNVIKVVWGDDWDPLLEKDDDGLLAKRMGEVVDGQYQKYTVSDGDFIRKDFFGKDPRLLEMISHLSNEQIEKMRRGGHDPEKIYAAYKSATENIGSPTVILAKTVKGYGMGEAGEGKNITHQQKSLNENELRSFRTRFGIPISDDEVAEAPFFRPNDDSPEMQYIRERRESLGGPVPNRIGENKPLQMPPEKIWDEFNKASGDRSIATTMAFVAVLRKLLQDKEIGKYIVPIIPDEARTFGMDPLFRQFGIYSSVGQLYEPVDKDVVSYYKEAVDGQILEEGINEAGAMSSWIAAGTSYTNHDISMIPIYLFYSMFGFQRTGDFAWAAGDNQTRGFLIGATAGRTTLAGEGLQHGDGHSHIMSSVIPNCKSYDPTFGYELATIFREGLRRMYEKQENIFYYITTMNENYPHPSMPKDKNVEKGILKGMYLFKEFEKYKKTKIQLLGSGTILREMIAAAEILQKDYKIDSNVWSVTSFNELRKEAIEVERYNLLNPDKKPKQNYIEECLSTTEGPVVSASDYMRLNSDQIRPFVRKSFYSFGTDGYGRSDTRKNLRKFFEVDKEHIVTYSLSVLAKEQLIPSKYAEDAIKKYNIDPEKPIPTKL